jgi:uncharacterized protein (TIGR01244 family)
MDLKMGGEAESMSTQKIYNYRQVNDHLITGGQPTEDQLRDAAKEGIQTVINLAPFEPGYSLPEEGNLVSSLGMAYYNIPVEWSNPTAQDFEAFEKLFDQVGEAKTLVHCAANFRVTAFYSLYALKKLGWSEEQADSFRMSVWQGSNFPIWENFISDMKAQFDQQRSASST